MLLYFLVGADYNAVSETLLFNSGRTRVCFFTSTVDNGIAEEDEVYILTLTSDEPGLTLDPDVATVTIIDDDRREYNIIVMLIIVCNII